jgi:hypothetical protein
MRDSLAIFLLYFGSLITVIGVGAMAVLETTDFMLMGVCVSMSSVVWDFVAESAEKRRKTSRFYR